MTRTRAPATATTWPARILQVLRSSSRPSTCTRPSATIALAAPPLPAEAPQPQASGPGFGTYDRDGKFIDPSGNIGVFTGGAAKTSPAESWVDLMSDPRQA